MAVVVDDEPATPVSDLDLASAIEAIVMVVDEPVSTLMLAQVLQRPEDDVDGRLRRACDRVPRPGARASSCARWQGGGGSTATLSSTRWCSDSSSMGSKRGLPRHR